NPGVHYSHAMAYDPRENVVVLFGGFNEEGQETSETWIFDFVTEDWTEVTSTTAPVARYGHAMVYDELSQGVILCCGNTATQGHQDDTWLFDANQTWTELSTVGEPARLKWTAYTYDSTIGRVVLFGGQVGDDATDDLWLYDVELNTWTGASPDVSPPARINSELAFDEANNIYVIHGGFNQEYGLYGDTWVYDPEENTWIEMGETSSAGTGPGDLLVVILIAAPIVVSVALAIVYLRRK
ncbi:MAG: kelch repeat-containing protein, partial [Promethearchaeota archaeon]